MLYDCPQPTPMLLTLNAHCARVSDIDPLGRKAGVWPVGRRHDPVAPVAEAVAVTTDLPDLDASAPARHPAAKNATVT
jgi:hypothetical protein